MTAIMALIMRATAWQEDWVALRLPAGLTGDGEGEVQAEGIGNPDQTA